MDAPRVVVDLTGDEDSWPPSADTDKIPQSPHPDLTLASPREHCVNQLVNTPTLVSRGNHQPLSVHIDTPTCVMEVKQVMDTQVGDAAMTERVAPPAKDVPKTNKRGAEKTGAENANKKQRTDAQPEDARASTSTTTDLPSVHPDILRVLKHDVTPTDADVRWLQQLGHVRALTTFDREACFAGLLAALEKALHLSRSVDVEGTSDRVRAAHVASILLEAYAALWASPTDYELHVCAGMLRESESNYSFAVRYARIDMEFRTFEAARAYVRTLGLKSEREWQAWRKSGARPHDIPSTPQTVYKLSGWTSYGDFLGYAVGYVAGEYRSFEDARAYVRTLGLKSTDEYKAWSKSGARPYDIPSDPQKSYKLSGWTSYGDFLGFSEGQGARGDFRSFEDARSYVRQLGLKSQKDWKEWRKSRPHDIPANPDTTYALSGWTSYGDFLGYAVGKHAQKPKASKFRSFEDARAYVRKLDLKSKEEWNAWSKSGARPHDIPGNPNKTYTSSGWTSFGDFLGYADGKVAGSYRSFEDARAYVRTLGLKSREEWRKWSKSDACPHDIPSAPEHMYKSSGWTSYGDFLGYDVGKVAGSFRSFEDARTYVRTLGLKSKEEWNAWSKSGERPHDIPSTPSTTYASSGWISYPDFLGYAEGQEAIVRKRKMRA
ncbi:methyltransferase domain-containing protein [Pycnococcus provasolii]